MTRPRLVTGMLALALAVSGHACKDDPGSSDSGRDGDALLHDDAGGASDSDSDSDGSSDDDSRPDDDSDAGDPDDADDAPSDSDTDDGGAPERWVTGYYAGYQRSDLPPAEVRWDALTHIAVAAVLPLADGTLDTTFYLDETEGPAMASDLASRAHSAGVVPILMVGGAGTHAGFVAAASDAVRDLFVSNLVDWAQDHGFDGFDLDWEPIFTSDQADFRALAEDLREAWPEAILTVPVGYLNSNFETVPAFYADIAPLFDQMNAMTYGMTGAYEGWQSWHSSALYGEGPTTPTSISDTIERYLAAGVPPAKLGIGIGFYGVCYTSPVTGPKQDLRGSVLAAADNSMSFENIRTLYWDPSAERRDDEAKSPYLSYASPVGPNRCTFISYEDAASIAERAAFVQAQGLGGAIVWTINEGHIGSAPAGERDPLMDALAEHFLRR